MSNQANDPSGGVATDVPPERAVREVKLLRLFDEIEGALNVSDISPDNAASLDAKDEWRGLLSSERAREVVALWSSLFSQEIALLGRARNSVAHARPVSETNLERAVELADRLLGLLRERLAVVNRLETSDVP